MDGKDIIDYLSTQLKYLASDSDRLNSFYLVLDPMCIQLETTTIFATGN